MNCINCGIVCRSGFCTQACYRRYRRANGLDKEDKRSMVQEGKRSALEFGIYQRFLEFGLSEIDATELSYLHFPSYGNSLSEGNPKAVKLLLFTESRIEFDFPREPRRRLFELLPIPIPFNHKYACPCCWGLQDRPNVTRRFVFNWNTLLRTGWFRDRYTPQSNLVPIPYAVCRQCYHNKDQGCLRCGEGTARLCDKCLTRYQNVTGNTLRGISLISRN